jgi:hypothetical protein
MNSSYNFMGRLCLIVVFVSAISITSGVPQPRSGAGSSRLIVQRAANFGWNLALHFKIDGRTVATIIQGRDYEGFISAGRHELTVLPVPKTGFRDPTSVWLDARPGYTYAFTAVWESDQVVLRRSSIPLNR